VFEKLLTIEFFSSIATFVLAIATFILAYVTVDSTRKYQKDQEINRDLNWIEKKVENFYNPLISLLGERKRLVNKYKKTEKTPEKEEIKKKLFANWDKINEIYSKYTYLGFSWENYFTDADIRDYEGSGLIDTNEIDQYEKILIKEFNELNDKHVDLMGKIKRRVVNKTSELEKIFKEGKEKKEF